MELPEFLLARIAEDEAVARKDSADVRVGWRWKHYPREAYEEIQAVTLAHSARVLAECGAKRAIVLDAVVAAEGSKQITAEFAGQGTARAVAELASAGAIADALRGVLAHLALPYADHPDYREEWRP